MRPRPPRSGDQIDVLAIELAGVVRWAARLILERDGTRVLAVAGKPLVGGLSRDLVLAAQQRDRLLAFLDLHDELQSLLHLTRLLPRRRAPPGVYLSAMS